MSILLVANHRDMTPFKEALERIDPNLDIEIWPHVKDRDRVQFAVAWKHPKEVFRQYPNLKVISSLGAGVDHLLNDGSIPESISFSRLVPSSLSEQMCDFVLSSVLNLFRKTPDYFKQQRRSEWNRRQAWSKKDLSVGVMGLGEMGRAVAETLALNKFRVHGWSRTKKEIPGIITWHAGDLDAFLHATNILICLLPLTPETEGILELEHFKKLGRPSFLINAARGEHLIEEDLIYALDTGLIQHAILDVFSTEPLPGSHPFWGRDKITITPHVASITYPDDVAPLIAENYKLLISGQPLRNVVDRKTGY